MKSDRRIFTIRAIAINGRRITRVVIDPHYEKHRDITDDLVLDLVRKLNGLYQVPEEVERPYEYYATNMFHEGKQYRLIWLLEDDEIYIGVITVYRRRKKIR